MYEILPSYPPHSCPVLGSLLYLDLTVVDLEPAVSKLLHSVMVLRGAQNIVFLLVLLVLGGLCRRVKAVRTEALQQRGHRLGLGQLGDLEVLLVVWCVLPNKTLLLHGKGRPFVFLFAPLAIFTVLLIFLVPTADDGFLRKVHSGLEKRG